MKTVVINSKSQPGEIVLKKGEKKTILVLCGKKTNLKVRMVGEGAEVVVLGVMVGRGDCELELRAEVVHGALRTKAEVLLRGVVYDGAKVHIHGSAVIKKGAKFADDSLREDVLLVGEKAKGETYPYLEIEENDVTAKHAATVGRIDREQLFYLATRGISQKEGEGLLASGFFEPILERIPTLERANIAREVSAL